MPASQHGPAKRAAEKEEAVGPQRRVVVGSSADAETTISHPGADPEFPSSSDERNGPSPASGFPVVLLRFSYHHGMVSTLNFHRPLQLQVTLETEPVSWLLVEFTVPGATFTGPASAGLA